MNLVKSKLSFYVWILYSVFALSFGFIFSSGVCDKLGLDVIYGICFTLILFAICILSAFLLKRVKIKKKTESFTRQKAGKIVIYILCLLAILGGLTLRLYLMFREGLFYKGIIISQICILLGIIFYSISIMRISGLFSALAFIAICMYSPYFVSKSFINGDIYLCFLISSLVFFVFTRNIPAKSEYLWVFGLAGILQGILVFESIEGLAFFMILPLAFLGSLQEKKIRNDVKTISVLMYVISAIISYFVLAFIFSLYLNISVVEVLKSLANMFKPSIAYSRYPIGEIGINSGIIFYILLIFGIPVGFMRKRDNPGCIYFLCLLIITIISLLGNYTSENFVSFISLILISMLCSEFMNDIFHISDRYIQKIDGEKKPPLDKFKLENRSVIRDKKEVVTDDEKTVKLLENPLPIPEKKYKGEMDYDHDVPEDADYDI